jgi:hypothetical protein
MIGMAAAKAIKTTTTMSGLVNYFKFIFSGYIRKKKVLNGIKVHFKYHHGAELFDPIAMILDQYFKIHMVSDTFKVKVDQYNFEHSDFSEKLAGLKPKLDCLINLPLGLLNVQYFVLREEYRTTSFYSILLNEEPLAFWHKKYDYGKERSSIIKNEIFGTNLKSNPALQHEEEPVLFVSSADHALYLEKFIHSHVFYVTRLSQYNNICQQLQKIYKINY